MGDTGGLSARVFFIGRQSIEGITDPASRQRRLARASIPFSALLFLLLP
jgi:hypothetical protein